MFSFHYCSLSVIPPGEIKFHFSPYSGWQRLITGFIMPFSAPTLRFFWPPMSPSFSPPSAFCNPACLKPRTSTILYWCKKLPRIQILKFIDGYLGFSRRATLQMASVRKPDTFFTKMLHETFMIKITLSFWGEKGDKCVLCGQISECWALRWPAGITDFRFILQDSLAKSGFSLSNNNAEVDQFSHLLLPLLCCQNTTGLLHKQHT